MLIVTVTSDTASALKFGAAFVVFFVGLALLAVGYQYRKWHRSSGAGSDGRWLILAGKMVGGVGVALLLTIAAQTQH
jgi:hypothetical protein